MSQHRCADTDQAAAAPFDSVVLVVSSRSDLDDDVVDVTSLSAPDVVEIK